MPVRLAFRSLLLAAVVGCGAPAPAPTRTPAPAPVAREPALAQRLDAAIDQAIAANQIVGAVVLVARDGEVVYARAAGYADREARRPMREDTVVRFASMTKPIVSVAALALIERGKLGLEDPVAKWLPYFTPKAPDGSTPTITVKQLLTHTAGLTYKFIEKAGGPYHAAGVSDGLAEPALAAEVNLKRLATAPLVAVPGTAWTYSLATDVLGEVVARAGGEELPSVVKHLVTGPLQMTDTVFAVTDRTRIAWPYAEVKGAPPVRMTEPYDATDGELSVRFSPARIFDSASYPSGGAGLAGTARDYLKFAEALRTGGGGVIPPERVQAMTENQVGELMKRPGTGFGYGVKIVLDGAVEGSERPTGVYGWGGIYGTEFWVDPASKLSVVILTNTAGDEPIVEAIEKAIYPR